MERGPTALFGAIVAVGLGPALWLGAQVGGAGISTTRPPAVISEHDSGVDKELLGGTGAGDDTTENGTTVIHSTPRANVMPLTAEPTVKPTSSPGRDSKPVQSASPPPSGSVDPSPSGEPSGRPSQSSPAPVNPPPSGGGGDETGNPITPPDPPASAGEGGSTGGDSGSGSGGDSVGSGGDSSTAPTVDRSSTVS